MREAADILSNILKVLAATVAPDINLLYLDRMAKVMIKNAGAESANYGYKREWDKNGYPAYTCIGVNNTIAHGIPHNYKLKDGDIVSIDLGIKKNGFCADAALTVPVGKPSNKDERLIYYAKKTLYEAISMVKAGVDVVEIGKAVEKYAQFRGYVTSRRFNGHGIGSEMHIDPTIPSFDITQVKDYPDVSYILKAGEIICLEPILTYNDREGVVRQDGWTTKTIDFKKSAFFEHMVEVTETGCNILTTHIIL